MITDYNNYHLFTDTEGTTAVEGPQTTMSPKVSVNKCFVIYQI